MHKWDLRTLGRACLVLGAAWSGGGGDVRAANLVQDPQFEHVSSVGSWTGTAGAWMGGVAASASSTPSISPHGGDRMLQFLQTHPLDNELGLHESCEVHQIVDLHAFAAQIDAGWLFLEASTLFNRVVGPPDVEERIDRQFELSLRTFEHRPLTEMLWRRHDSPVATGPLHTVSLVSDSNVLTWELLDLVIPLPPRTRWAVMTVSAVEDVMNDNEVPEFSGHYADSASLRVIPEPARAAAGICIMVLLARRRG